MAGLFKEASGSIDDSAWTGDTTLYTLVVELGDGSDEVLVQRPGSGFASLISCTVAAMALIGDCPSNGLVEFLFMLGILWLAAFWADLGTEVNPGRKSVAPSFCSFATLDREKMRSFIEGHFSKDLFRSSWLSSRSSVKQRVRTVADRATTLFITPLSPKKEFSLRIFKRTDFAVISTAPRTIKYILGADVPLFDYHLKG